MQKKKIFISSVQSEFSKERKLLTEFLTSETLLGKFFDIFLFENLPALNRGSEKVYLNEVKQCDIYLGLFGKEYGHEDSKGISATEKEFNCAVKNHKTKLVFLTVDKDKNRHPKEIKLIKKAEKFVIRKKFSNDLELKTSVYNALIRYLEENEYIRTLPFDAAINNKAVLNDLDEEKIKSFVHTAHNKRAFPFTRDIDIKTILTHLNLIENEKITNAAILLFGKKPQKFFISSEVRCAHFHGYDMQKPIPNYQVYKGDLFELINQAVNFVLSNITVSTGSRDNGVEVDVHYELPVAAVTEAIVNAVVHRDYTSNGSIQVMLFKDRLEIWNPGHLPFGMTVAKLKQKHTSIPVNPLLAEPLYLAGTIERMGTGTEDIIKKCKKEGLKPPEFIQEENFIVILWRNEQSNNNEQLYLKYPTNTHQTIFQASEQAEYHADYKAIEKVPIKYPPSTHQVPFEYPLPTVPVTVPAIVPVTVPVTEQVLKLLKTLIIDMDRKEMQKELKLTNKANFLNNYLQPAIEQGYISMKYPDSPNHPKQRYSLTQKGKNLVKKHGK